MVCVYICGPSADKPLSAPLLEAELVVPGGLWTDVRVVVETGSTNSDVLALARDGAPAGLVLAAEAQTAGRGRQDRSWRADPGAALTFSLLVRPRTVSQGVMGWLPLLAGVATAEAVRAVAGAQVTLKWPNDVLLGEGKLAGILAEQSGDVVVVGIGLNVRGSADSLPVATATSLEQHGAATDRAELLVAILRRFETWYLRWSSTDAGDAQACGLRPAYLYLCRTVGQRVQVALPGGRSLAGVAVDVDATGRLIVKPDSGEPVPVSAGDVMHVR
jgi:BirA family transcriptional regulator, biotin operon repressor / biotin---[acetyl-CoA-carboxylase] ligase